MSKELELFFQENNFKSANNVMYGIYRNYLMSFAFIPGFVKVSIELVSALDQFKMYDLTKKLDEINANFQNVKLATYGNLSIDLLFVKTFNNNNSIIDVLYILVSKLIDLKIPGVDTCPICSRNITPNDPIIKIGTVVLQVHQNCFNFLQSAEKLKKRTLKYKKLEKRNYFTGFLGALLGVVLFSILWILLYKYSMAVSLLAIPMFIISKYLYEIFYGKKDSREILILLILNGIFILVSVFLGSIINLTNQADISFFQATNQFFQNLQNPDFLKRILGDLIIGYLSYFITYGVVKTLFRYFVDETSKIEIIKK